MMSFNHSICETEVYYYPEVKISLYSDITESINTLTSIVSDFIERVTQDSHSVFYDLRGKDRILVLPYSPRRGKNVQTQDRNKIFDDILFLFITVNYPEREFVLSESISLERTIVMKDELRDLEYKEKKNMFSGNLFESIPKPRSPRGFKIPSPMQLSPRGETNNECNVM